MNKNQTLKLLRIIQALAFVSIPDSVDEDWVEENINQPLKVLINEVDKEGKE